MTLLGVILLTCVLSYVVLRSATQVTTLLGQTGLHILSRLMGLLLAVIAVQFILNGMRDALPGLLLQQSQETGRYKRLASVSSVPGSPETEVNDLCIFWYSIAVAHR